MTTRIFASIFVCLFSVAVLGQQQGPKPQGPSNGPSAKPPSRWWTTEKYRQELKLTAEQTAHIEKIFQASMDRMKVQKEDFDRAQSDFSQLMKQGAASERELLRAADSLELARFKVSSERTSMLVRIHSVLTPEQRLLLQAISKRDRDHDRNGSR
ncbi:MAG: Spy/CpxP family protein refolding chaperone [Vicinamibacterales bacterium]|nr:Spy/CpxP family protein refolding chaperone [Vicinamibacterales bacterium]